MLHIVTIATQSEILVVTAPNPAVLVAAIDRRVVDGDEVAGVGFGVKRVGIRCGVDADKGFGAHAFALATLVADRNGVGVYAHALNGVVGPRGVVTGLDRELGYSGLSAVAVDVGGECVGQGIAVKAGGGNGEVDVGQHLAILVGDDGEVGDLGGSIILAQLVHSHRVNEDTRGVVLLLGIDAHGKVVGACLLDLEVNLPVGEGAIHVIGVVIVQHLEGRHVGRIGADEQAGALLVVGKGVAHVHDQRIGDALLDVDTRRNQVVVGAVLVFTHVVGTGVDTPATVVVVELPGVLAAPVASVVVGIDNGPQAAGRRVAEVVEVGCLKGRSGQDAVGHGVIALLAIGIEGGHDVVVALHLGGQRLAELTGALVVGDEHIAGHAHDIVGEVLQVAAIDAGRGSVPRQVAHTAVDGQGEVLDGLRRVIASIDVEAVGGRVARSVLKQDIHIVVVVAHILAEALLAAGNHAGIVEDDLAIEPHGSRHVAAQVAAAVGGGGNGKGDRAAGRRAVKGECQVGGSGGSHVGSLVVQEEDRGSLLVVVQRLDQGHVAHIGVDGIDARALLGDGHPHKAAAVALIAHTLHIHGGGHVEGKQVAGIAGGLVQRVELAVATHTVHVANGREAQGQWLEVVGPRSDGFKQA